MLGRVTAQSPSDTPTGEVAFSSDRGGLYQTYLMDADGSNAQLLISGDRPVYTPIWSPDGSKLAHVVDQEGKFPLFVWDMEQSNSVKLADDALNPYSLLTWSSDSQHISYANWLGGDSSAGVEYHSISVDGKKNTQLSLKSDQLALIHYSADQSLLIVQSDGIYSADADGSNLVLITNHFAYPAALSPKLDRFVGYNTTSKSIEITDLKGENPQVIVDATKEQLLYLLFVGWSPDEQYIWGVGRFANAADAAEATEFRVFVSKSDGTAFHLVNTIDTQITWSPNSQFIAYTRQDAAQHYQIFTSQPDGSSERQITTEGNNSQPAWRPQ